MKFLTLGYFIDGDLIAGIVVIFCWAWRPRTSAFYITAVVCSTFFIAYFDSMLLKEPMPLMVSGSGSCFSELVTPARIVSITSASLVLYYEIEPDLIGWGQDVKYYYMAINIAYILVYGLYLVVLG